MERLIVKNFGPLKDVDIELNRINLFIGENGSGKSVLAKIVTILLDFRERDEKEILKKFSDYNIKFFSKETFIQLYITDELLVEIKNKTVFLHNDLKSEIDVEKVNKIQKDIQGSFKLPKEIETQLLDFLNANSEQITQGIEKFKKFISQIDINKMKERFNSQYIPAERNFISLFNRSISSILVAEVPLPKFLLSFMSEFEKAGNELKELEFLNVKYVNGDGLDRHKVYFNDEDYLPLEFSSSGIQSALPLYLTVKYFAKKHHAIVIEEPEQNLFPKAQAKTIKYIIEQVSYYNSLFMMTHSPYVLSTLNNLIMAYKVAQMSKETKEQVKELIKEEQWINPNEFSAYYLEDGIAKNIVSKRGLISDNEIDDISEEITGEFDDLMQIYREFKYAK